MRTAPEAAGTKELAHSQNICITNVAWHEQENTSSAPVAMAGAGGIGSRIIARMEGRRYYLEAHLNQVSASDSSYMGFAVTV